MNTKRRKIAISTLIVCFFVSVITLAAVTLYPNAKISFKGIKLVSNGATTQGFVDIYLKDIDTTALSFCLEYDDDYIELSDVQTNTPIQNKTTAPGMFGTNYNTDYKYFSQNTEDFPGDNFNTDPSFPVVAVHAPIIGIADAEYGRVLMNFTPIIDAFKPSSYIGIETLSDGNEEIVLRANNTSVKLGTLSFCVKDPSAFAKLTKSQLQDIIKIVPFSTMTTLEDDTIATDDGVHIGYIDSDEDISWYSRADKNIECDFEIEAELSDVKPIRDTLTVTSYEIFNQGTKDDLLDYLNEKVPAVVLEYADGSQRPGVFKWDLQSITGTYDPKGGTYTITQKYNDDFDVTVAVNVTPVTFVGYEFENEVITYYTQDADYPQTLDDLNLPEKVKVVLDTYIPNGGIPELELGWYQLKGDGGGLSDLPQGIKDKTPDTYLILGHTSGNDYNINVDFAWLTINGNLPDIEITRIVVDNDQCLPKEITVDSAVTADDGTMTIIVKCADGFSSTDFVLKMPGGEIIDPLLYTVNLADNTTVEITLKADINTAGQEKLAQIINVGAKAGEFQIAMAANGVVPQGKFVPFTSNARKNIYLGNYTFDYSDSLAAMFPIKATDNTHNLSTTVTLPCASDYIGTTYDGMYGTEIGMLQTFTVDGWDVISGDPTQVGDVVEIRGVLSTTSYTNYGLVENANNNTVTIKYLVVDNSDWDAIDAIPDFEYDKQQVGYDYDKLQTNSFTVKNIGATDIYGLSARISLSKDTGVEAFVVTKSLPPILQVGDSVEFDITTVYGLPIGVCECTVDILSDDGVLQTFKITFEVTEEPTYKIDISLDTADFGSAKTDSGLYTSMEGETVTIIAEPKEDCIFVGWTCEFGDITFADASSETTSFTMPDSDVKITAHFKESLAAKLRATELMIVDEDNSPQTFYDSTWKTVVYDPATREYYVAVPNTVEKVSLWFKPRTEAVNATFSLTHEHNVTDTLAIPTEDTNDNYYKSQLVALDASPTENILTLTMEYDDPNDNPDEGLVKASYKIHIYRKIEESKLMVFNYGNSPYGEIMRDSAIMNKQDAKDEFINNGYKLTSGYTPSNLTVGTEYSPLAWKTTNYDLDESALFVINSQTFEDVGYDSVTNSIGDVVTTVSKKITVNVLAETNSAYQDGGADDYASITSKTISLSSSGTISELNNERIRPDAYELVYSFTDFDGSTVSIKRPLILLNTLGDVNNDKSADSTDISEIKTRFKIGLADSTNVNNYITGGLLNKYRICDVNKDGAFNLIDANALSYQTVNQFYVNTGGGA